MLMDRGRSQHPLRQLNAYGSISELLSGLVDVRSGSRNGLMQRSK